MARAEWLRRRVWGLVVGVTVTAAVMIAHLAGLLDRPVLALLDLGFRHVNRVKADERIVLIDIDDTAIETIGRWPWPRRRFAELIDTLHESGAKVIAMDIVFSEPMPPRFEHPALSEHYDVDRPRTVLGEVRPADAVRDDDELAEAIRRAGNVYLAMFSRIILPGAQIYTESASPEDAFLASHPDASFEQYLAVALPGQDTENRSPQREKLLRAYRAARAMMSAVHGRPQVRGDVAGRIPRSWDLTLPLDKLAAAARGSAFVTFEPDWQDGVVRHIPTVIVVGDRLVPHLAMAVACDLLDVDLGSAAWVDGFLAFADRAGQRRWRIPLNAEGKTLLNWHIAPRNPQWWSSFTHVPVTRVMEVPLNRAAMHENERLLGLTMAQAVQERFGDDHGGYAEYEALVRRRNESGDESGLAAIEAVEKQTLDWLAFVTRETQDVAPKDEPEVAQFALYRDLHDKLVKGTLREEVRRKNERLEARNAELMAELGDRLRDKVCFVGYTATAIADTVNTPVFADMPGVLVHANLLNSFLHNQFPRMSSPAWGAAMIAVSGLLITLLTCSRGPWVSLSGVGILIAVVLLLGLIPFRASLYYLTGIAGAVFAVFVSWAFITLYRQVVEQRQTRRIARSLARQTSPAIAAQIARGATEADFAPRPAHVTCYFSDLQGFTPLSEAIGPEGTKEVLNRYLGAMSEVLLRHRGTSKFMGDGIFAYFNAPIWPCSDHAVAGCEAALDCLDALANLKREQAGGAFAGEFESLVMRAGLHTGPVFAGWYGSGDRAEYTCIGDTVNLAARLEPVNKVLRTRILVSEACREEAGDRYEFRCLGRIQVKGRRRAAMVYELLGRKGAVGAAQLEYAEAFAEAIFLFRRHRWEDARRAFDRCTRLRADDPAVDLYNTQIERFREEPPPADWEPAVELIVQ